MRRTLTALGLISLLLGLLTPAVTAQAAEPTSRTITGTVRDADGTPLPGVRVRLYEEGADDEVILVATATTTTDGTYRLPGLDDLNFGVNVIHYLAFDDRTRDLAPIRSRIDAEPQEQAIDAVMRVPGTVTGSVSREFGSAQDTAIELTLREAPGVTAPEFTTTSRTSSDGTFRVSGLHPGTYELSFRDTADWYGDQCLGGTPRCYDDGAKTVVVTDGETTVLPPERLLHVRGALSGGVTDASGNPITLRSVGAVRSYPESSIDPDDYTDEEQDVSEFPSRTSKSWFWFTGITPGRWTLRTRLDPGVWENRYLGNTTDWAKARFVDVVGGKTSTGHRIALRTMPRISVASSSPAKGYAALTVKVTKANNGTAAWGDVTVAIGGQTKRATLEDGKASFRFKGLAAGRRTATVTNLGNSYTASGSKGVAVVVR